MENLFDLTGKVAVVTGAAKDSEAAISTGLAAFGADIALLDVSDETMRGGSFDIAVG